MSNTRRVDRGRTHSYLLDGQPVDGVTSILSKGLPKPALIAWAARETARFASSNKDLITRLGEDELFDLFKGAPFRDRDRAANRGTEVHKLAQKLAAGEEVEVPDELVGHVDAYLKFREDWRPRQELVECPVFNRKHRYAGTADLFCQLPDYGQALLDAKTNRSGPFADTALQLAAYSHADFMLVNGREEPIPEIEFFGVLWLHADGYDVFPYDVTDREWKAFLFAQQVAWWLDYRAPAVKGEAIWRPAEEVPA